MSDLLSCISVFHMPGTCEGQKRVSVVLGLELQMVISCHLGAGNWTWVHCKNSKCSYLLAHPSSPSRPAFYLWFFNILPLSSYKITVPCKILKGILSNPNSEWHVTSWVTKIPDTYTTGHGSFFWYFSHHGCFFSVEEWPNQIGSLERIW